jgi:hypothetical protein
MSPQTHDAGQSIAHVLCVSPHMGSQSPSPQKHELPQSEHQLGSSPH